ncbi:guanine deaminase [Coleophoma crateriformis]|uniref:Guanine deaminase n=1 Tax=Coleophoma crateriformis TaxID=565419 RepID=A0A3D8RHV7_9HELO|nr:guanine deaminase [Coleophoma crateriformis]
MPSSNKHIFIGRIVHSLSLKKLEILPWAGLGIENDTIVFVDRSIKSVSDARKKYPSFATAASTVLSSTQFLFPGLIDTHLHAPQWPNLAMGMEGNLAEWVRDYTDPIEASYSDNEKAKRVYSELVQKELELGSTTVAYNSTIHYQATNILADMCLKYGQRSIIGKLCILGGATHHNYEKSVEQSLEDEEKSVEYIQKIDPTGKLVLPCIQPRGGPWAPPALMDGLGKMSQNGGGEKLHVQAHMCETEDDIEKMRKVHPGFENYGEMYKSHGLLHEKSILAHCIHLSDVDIAILAETGAGVAHNPNSNTCLRDGVCRVRELLDKGVKVGLGTDCSAGYSTFMLDSMRQASNVSRHLSMRTGDDNNTLGFTEIVYLGTLGSAGVLSMQDQIGNFLPGKLFDALLIDVGGNDCINISGWEKDDLALVKKWVFMGDDRSIRKVFVNGVHVAGKDKPKKAAWLKRTIAKLMNLLCPANQVRDGGRSPETVTAHDFEDDASIRSMLAREKV